MPEPVTVGDVAVEPGQSAFGALRCGVLAGGTECRIGFQVINGRHPGPTLCLISTLHGWEPMGAEIIRRALLGIDPRALAGTVISVPIANPFALEFGGTVESSGTVVNPSDNLNLNRVFPGKNQYAWLTERMAFLLFDEVVRRSDVVLDFHDGTGATKMLPVGLFPDLPGAQGERLTELAKAFGAPVGRRHSPSYPGLLVQTAATELGIIGMSPHIAGMGIVDENVDKGAVCIRNAMKHLGMIDGEPDVPAGQFIDTHYLVYRSETGGFLFVEDGIELGGRVRKGQVIARVIDPLTSQEREVCTAPFDAVVSQLRVRLPLNPGGYVCHLDDLSSVIWERA